MTLLRQSQIALAEVEVVVFDISIRATARLLPDGRPTGNWSLADNFRIARHPSTTGAKHQ